MGYYSGNGETTSGGGGIQPSVVHPLLISFRKEVVEMVVKNGVSLATAKGVAPSISNTSGNCSDGSYTYPIPMRNGTIVRPHYSQINGSNLYRLEIETTNYTSKVNNGSWA